MKCIVIDDESTARAIMAKLCATIPNLDIIQEFDNAIEAIKFLNHQEVDLVFLDIHMPGFTGIDFVQTIKNPTKIVMTTSDPEFAIAAYEYSFIVDYLLKPITLERFEKCIEKVRASNLLKSNETSAFSTENPIGEDLYVNIDRRLIKIRFVDILLIEARGDYINIKTQEKDYMVHTTLKKIKAKLPSEVFLQIHRSYIINYKRIIDIEDNSVLIEKNVVPVSRSNRQELMRRLNLL